MNIVKRYTAKQELQNIINEIFVNAVNKRKELLKDNKLPKNNKIGIHMSKRSRS